jgi:hypothetical protein
MRGLGSGLVLVGVQCDAWAGLPLVMGCVLVPLSGRGLSLATAFLTLHVFPGEQHLMLGIAAPHSSQFELLLPALQSNVCVSSSGAAFAFPAAIAKTPRSNSAGLKFMNVLRS